MNESAIIANGTFMGWFAGPYNPSDPHDKRINYERIAYLVACNGGQFDVVSWGTITLGDGCFKAGLTQEEGLELIQVGSFINGANLIDDTIWPYALKTVKEWISNRLDEYEKSGKVTVKDE